jgi:ubiquinone/menaquinone biosynthesis C-methylase UbiE
VSIKAADIHQLPVDSKSVDRVHTDRVLQHASSPAEVLHEAARVLRRSGRIVCAEPDWATPRHRPSRYRHQQRLHPVCSRTGCTQCHDRSNVATPTHQGRPDC